jgi:hypothetical protein
LRLGLTQRKDQSVAPIPEGTPDLIRNLNLLLILTPHQQRRIHLQKNFIQRQIYLNLIAVATGRKELRRRTAQFPESDLYRAPR